MDDRGGHPGADGVVERRTPSSPSLTRKRPEARNRARVGRLMVECVREDARPEAGPTLGAAEADALVAAARYHRVVGYVRAGVEGTGLLDGSTAARLWALHQVGLDRQRVVLEDLRLARAVLDGLGLVWLVVKGPVLGESIHRRPELRLYNDLDLIVPAGDFGRAVTALEEAGYRVFDRNWRLIRQAVAGEVHLARGSGSGIDLHWQLLYSERLRRKFPIPMDNLVDRARPVVVSGVPTATLDPSDTLIHLCVHAGVEGGDRLLWLKDIERAVVNDPPDWDAVVRRCRDWSVHLMVGAMLARSNATLGAPVPGDVVRALVPTGWRNVLAAADRLFPPERSRGMGSPATLAVRASEASALATVAAMTSGLATRVKHVVHSRKPARHDVRRQRDDPGSVLYPAGDDSDRAAFFEAVAGDGPGAGGR